MYNPHLFMLGQMSVILPILIAEVIKQAKAKRERERSKQIRSMLLTAEENNDHAENYPEVTHE